MVAKPACLGYEGFPGTLCIEVNETVVHGFPSDYELRDGDIVGIDTVVEKTDSWATRAILSPWRDKPREKALCRTTRDSLSIAESGLQPAVAWRYPNAVQTYCERRGYSVVREMCGHGIGRQMHESPEVPNYGRRVPVRFCATECASA